MTPDQATALDDKLQLLRCRLNNFFIPHPTTDDADANTIIAEARIELSRIDQELFECYRLMERFHDTTRPSVASVARPRPAPSIDDLEI